MAAKKKTSAGTAAKKGAAPRAKPAAAPPAKPAAPPRAARAPAARLTLRETLEILEKAGTAQTRKTWLRHGVPEPMYGVSFATIHALSKRIGVDHDLACALWDTGNYDARNLAVKVADPARMTSADLDRWASEAAGPIGSYVALLTADGPHGQAKASQWLARPERAELAWALVGRLAMTDERLPDAWFAERLAEIERSLRSAPNAVRAAMNGAIISIGCRSAGLRAQAVAVAHRVGKVEVDHGDTECKTPDAAAYLEKTWAHSTSKGFATPAAHERTRGSLRVRC